MTSKIDLSRAAGVLLRTATAVLALALWGCAELSFKPGATPGDMQRDEVACRESSADEDAFVHCMKGRGYLISKAGDGLEWTPASR